MKRNTQILGMTLLAGALALGTVSCKKKGCTDPVAVNFDASAEKDDESCEYDVSTSNIVKTGGITADETWTANNVYQLDGRVFVDNGATLTIEAGTIIKGSEGTGANASALIVARGSKIVANGTATSPIIFTSILDNIQPGELTGTNLDENDAGKWGGVIILGNAPTSADAGDTETQIEGIPAGETYGEYGGNDAADNSGSLNYVSIRHGGALIGAGNEINGLTLGGVGTGTVINNVEVIANLDDGIEFFGGTVNVNNALVGFQGDDGIDIDMNYSGTVDNFFVLGGVSSDEGLEIDGPEGSTYTDGLFTLSNGTVFSATGDGSGSEFKSKAQGTVSNVVISGYASNAMKFRAAFSDVSACTDKADAYLYLTQASPILNFTSCEVVGATDLASAVSVFNGTDGADACVDATYETTAEAAVANGTSLVSTATVGGNPAVFAWTWAAVNGKL
ncbi:MAG: hypothetical protein ACPGU5_03810 [Lishizhenia sp.]